MKILYIQYTNPAYYPPLEQSSQILAASGWQALFLGVGVSGGDRLAFNENSNIRVKRLAACRAGWKQKLHFGFYCAWVFGCAVAWRPTWVYASDLTSAPSALLLSWIPGVRLIYHEHDSPGTGAAGAGLFHRVALWARSRAASRAEFCILPNRKRAERFRQDISGARKVMCVWNCPSRDEAQAPRDRSADGEMWVLYQGSLSSSRLPATVLHALRQLPSTVKLRIVGYETLGHPTFLADFTSLARELGVFSRLDIVGALDLRSKMLENTRKCHVGLALMPTQSGDWNEQNMAGASNKPFDYLASGLAVLVSDLADWKSMYVEPGYGLSCIPEEADSIAAALRWFFEHRQDTAMMGERGRRRIVSEWNYETQFSPVLRELQTAGHGVFSTTQA